jgi:hypothetical protein
LHGWTVVVFICPLVTKLREHVVQYYTAVQPWNKFLHVRATIQMQSHFSQRTPSRFEGPNCVFVLHPGICKAIIEVGVDADVRCWWFVCWNNSFG